MVWTTRNCEARRSIGCLALCLVAKALQAPLRLVEAERVAAYKGTRDNSRMLQIPNSRVKLILRQGGEHNSPIDSVRGQVFGPVANGL